MIRARVGVAILALSCAAAVRAHHDETTGQGSQQIAPPNRSLQQSVEAHGPKPERVSLPALVIPDPRQQRRVSAGQSGVIELAGKALPLPGQAVKAGQVLAWLRPVLTQPERRDLGVELAGAERDTALGRLQIDRYQLSEAPQFEVKLQTPTLQILTDYRSAKARSGELRGAMQQPVALRAPQDGVILRSAARAGSVTPEGALLFEIDTSGALAVSVDYIDEDFDAAGADSATTMAGREVSLRLLGEAYDAATRSHRAIYVLTGDTAGIVVNEPLRLAMPRKPAAP